jgi:flagellum-specific peptidoglycan hydrolase FlgJ
MLSPDQQKRLADAGKAAIIAELSTGCPAILTVAQWALESGWGQHQPGLNAFGIKHYRGAFGRQDLTTTEYIGGHKKTVVQAFAKFATLFDCFEKHGELITEHTAYLTAFDQYRQDHDIETLARSIAKVYATDPHYADKLLAVMRMPAVVQSVGEVRCESEAECR